MNREETQQRLLNQLLAAAGGRQKLWESLRETIERHPDYMSVARKALDPNFERGGQHG
jgi:hypothetical protein